MPSLFRSEKLAEHKWGCPLKWDNRGSRLLGHPERDVAAQIGHSDLNHIVAIEIGQGGAGLLLCPNSPACNC